jgi:hypothetical protein
MGWLSWLKQRANRDRVRWGDDTFVPREWNEYFRGLTPDRRRAAALAVCREVLAAASLHGEGVDRAITALEQGSMAPHVTQTIGSLVDRLEAEYESLVGGHESKLSCTDPMIAAAFLKARAATALRFALEGGLKEMAYEAYHVLDCHLDGIRNLVGMLQPKR